MQTSPLEARVTHLEQQLRRAHRLLTMGGVFAVVAIAMACKSPPPARLQMGNVSVDNSGIRIADERGEVRVDRTGLTITRLAIAQDGGLATVGGSTTVGDGVIELKTGDAGSLTLQSTDRGPFLLVKSQDADLTITAALPGSASIIAHADKTNASFGVFSSANKPSCEEGAPCMGTATLYLDDGRGHTEKLSTHRSGR